MFSFRFFLLTILSFLIFPLHSAQSEMTLYETDHLSVSGSLDIAIAGFQTSNTNFGGGLETPGGRSLRHVAYSEGFALPVAHAEFTLPEAGTAYGGVGWVLAMTRGDGDPGANSFHRPEHISNERLFIGWRSGNSLPGGAEDWLDISWGRQDFEIGNGFLIADGNDEGIGKSAILLGPRTAFESAGLIRINTRPVRADLFHLTTDNDNDNANLYGLNIEWHDDLYGELGLYGFRIYEAVDDSTRNGLSVLAGRGDIHPLATAGWPEVNLAFEVAWQHNGRNQNKLNALGWYASLGYAFTDWLWQPRLSYRYSHFSGDNPDTAKDENFDPLFVAGPGFGTWFQGEIIGQYLITNSNLNIHSLHLTAQPSDTVSLGALYFHNSLDQAAFEGKRVGATNFAQEINLYAEIALGDHVTFTPLGALAWPGKAAEEIYGDNKIYGLIEGFLTLSF